MDNIFRLVKEAKIDLQYLSSIGFDISKKTGKCPIHNGDNKHGFSYKEGKDGNYIFRCYTKGCTNIEGKEAVDVIGLCMLKENLANRYEAAKHLANMFNIEVAHAKPKKKTQEQLQQEQKQKKNNFKVKKANETAKSIDKKLLVSNIESANTADIEKINYADYVANERYYIDKFISEENMSIVNLLLDNRDTLLIAPPGSGKTRAIIENCKRFNIKSIFVLPLAANVEQTANTYNLHAAYDNLDLIEALEKSDNIVVCTWDKLQQLKNYDISEYKIILDEVHQIFTDRYREKAINKMLEITKTAKSRLDVTATPTMLNFKNYDHIVEYLPNKKTIKNVKLYDNVDTKIILDIVNNSSNKSMVLMNNKTILDMLSSDTTQKHDVINAESKHKSKLYKLLMENSTMGDFKVLYHTTTLLASYNIDDTDITDIIVVADRELKNISNIIQDIARPRKVDNIRVHIFGKFKEECTALSIDWLIEKDISRYEKIAAIYDESINEEFTTLKINVTAAAAYNGYIYYDKDLGKHVVDEIKIRADIYNNYYNTRTIENFATLLEEYLDPGVDTVEFIRDVKEQQQELIKQTVKSKKEAKNEAIEKLEKHKEILVGYNDLVKGNKSYKLNNYMIDNNLHEEHILEQYKQNNLHEVAIIAADTLTLFSEYILDYKYTYDLSWKLANMHHNTRNHKFINPIKNIIYREIKELYPNEIIAAIDNRVYDYLVENIKPGMKYTTEHVELLSKDLTDKFHDNKKYNITNTRKLLNEIFNISSKAYTKGTIISVVNFNFYINNTFTSEIFEKLTRVYTIENILTINDIKKELQLHSSDNSIENSIQKKIKKIIDSHAENKQLEQQLLEDIFKIC